MSDRERNNKSENENSQHLEKKTKFNYGQLGCYSNRFLVLLPGWAIYHQLGYI